MRIPYLGLKRTAPALIAMGLLAGESAMSYEQPDYTVLFSDGDVEYRQYEPYLVAETAIQGMDNYRDAGAEGFKRLFAYISGANRSQQKISMTVPVAAAEISSMSNSEKISMTVPVQQSQSALGWTMSFTLPSAYDLNTAPLPVDERVYIRAVPGRLMAVQSFASRWTEQSFSRQEGKLRAHLQAADVLPTGKMERAVYNAPFSLPFTRRNEVMVSVSGLPAYAQAIAGPALAAQ